MIFCQIFTYESFYWYVDCWTRYEFFSQPNKGIENTFYYLSLHKNKFTGRSFSSRNKEAELLVFFLQAFPDSWLPEELETVVYHGGSARTYVGSSSKQLIRIHHPFV